MQCSIVVSSFGSIFGRANGIFFPPNFVSIVLDFLEGKNVAVYYDPMTSPCSSQLHFSLVFLVSVTSLVFMAEGPLLGKDLV